MKKTISIIVFVIVLPVIVIAFFILLNSHTENNIVATTFPYQPEKVINKKWIAVVFKTECAHCKYVLADLSSIFTNNAIKDFELVAISKSSRNNTFDFLSNYEIPFPIVIADEKLREQLKVRSIPTVFFIDENNIVKHKFVGRKSKSYLEKLLNEYFKSGKILMSSLSSIARTSKNSQYVDIWNIIQKDTSLIDISEQFSENMETATELLSIKRKYNRDIVYNYTVYYPNCECDETEAEDFTYFSVIMDASTKTLIDQYYSDAVYKNEIINLNTNNDVVFSNYAN